MGFHIVDMIIIGLILFLAIRGLVNGFSKELFNFLALIGGIAVAARSHSIVGEFITQQNILPNLSSDVQKLVGFAIVLSLILILFKILSSIQSHVESETPGVISRILGYSISVARFIAIFSLIIFGINNADFLKEKFSKKYEGSQLFDPMVKIGGKLLNVQQEQSSMEDTNRTKKISDNNNTDTSREHNISIDVSNILSTDNNLSK